MDELPVIQAESEEAWEAWLEEHHTSAPGALLKLAKKGTGVPSVSQAEAVRVALCFGWIDSQGKKLDTSTGCCASHRGARAANGLRLTVRRPWS